MFFLFYRTLLELVRKREKMKAQHLRYTIDIFEKRYVIGDFSGQVLAEVSAIKHVKPPYATANNRALTDKNKVRKRDLVIFRVLTYFSTTG